MPVRSPGYNVPSFPPTGNAEVDKALTEWAGSFGSQYRQGLEERERLPYIVSTFSNTTQAVGGTYIGKKVTLQGGEQVQVSGMCEFSVNETDALGTLRITYPGGTTLRKTSQPARLGVASAVTGLAGSTADPTTNARSTVIVRATVGYVWAIDARFQTGGEHAFDLVTSGGGSIKGGTISVLVL